MRPVIGWTKNGELFNVGHSEPVVAVLDAGGHEWHVTVEAGPNGKPVLTSLTIRGPGLTPAGLRQVPLGYLTEAASGYIAEVERQFQGGAPLGDALDIAASAPGGLRLRGEPPTPEEFAERWNATASLVIVRGERLARRQALADFYGVTVWTVDKWSRAARDQGLISKQTKGSPRGPRPERRKNGTDPIRSSEETNR
jgi:hypothetical protein